MPNQESQQHRFVDEFSQTQPILETLLKEFQKTTKDFQEATKKQSSAILAVQRHLDEQDKKLDVLSSQIALAGNLAGQALAIGEENNAILKKMDQSLLGVIELAKSAYDIATEKPTPIRDTDIIEISPDSEPEVEFEHDSTLRRFQIVGTGN